MKRNLLFVMLIAMFAPLAMNAQQTLPVADQGGTTSDSHVPFEGLYADDNYQHTQTIYPSSMLTAMQGGTITKLTYYLKTAITTNLTSTFEVRLGTTTQTSFSSGTVNYISMTGSANYTGTIDVTNSSKEVTITLATPYTYNGGNLVVDVRLVNHTTGYKTTDFLGETGSTYYSVYSRTSSSQPPFTQGSAASFMPKTTFTYLSTDPYISLAPASATVFTGFTQTLTATYGNVSGTPTITYSSSNTSVATVSGSGTTATVTAVAPGTATITATMNGSYTATCAITVEDPSYCAPSFSSPSDDYISNFTTTGGDSNINNSSTYVSGGYSDYYNSYSALIEQGGTLTCSVTPSSTSWSYGHAIWVDWNNDYTFGSDEKVAYTSSTATGVWTANFTVPATTAPGDYRLRVIHYYNNTPTDPCMSASYGEAEDYKLTVLSTGAYTITCATTTGGTISADKNNADENDVVTITATPETDYLLTALTYTPEGGSAQNIDITNMPYTFTMPAANVTVNATFSLPACPRPTNVTVSNLAASHATVSWDSEAGNYTVKYSTATVTGTTLDPVFEDGFENGLGNWTTYANGFSGEGTTNWQTFDGSQFEDQTNHGGSFSAMSRSWTSSTGDVDVDNWLVSPQMTLGNTLKFWVTTNSGYPGSYAVYVSTGSGVVPSSGTGDFEVVANLTLATGSWVEQTYDLSAYAGQQGYVAIRHKDNAQDYFLVDDFGVYNTINTYSYGGWTTVSPNPTTESCQITGLSAETLYAVQVQANCGGSDGSSAWSTIYFTTPDNCGAPQELASSNVTINSATLNWADDKDSYNLQYRKVYFHEGFESETMPTGWTTIDNNNDGLCWHIGSSTAHSGVNGVCNSSFVYSSDFSVNTTPDDYLISPQLDLQGTLRVWLSGYPRSSSNYSEHFEILLSTTGTSVSDFTTTLVAESTTTNSYVEYTADLSSYAGQKGYIAIRHFNCTDQNYLYVDDFGLYGSENWVALNPNPTTETANLTGLTPNTRYEWQVQGVNCDGNGGTTEWSEVATFSTLEGYTKDITAYSGDGGWYLIASPVTANVTPAANNGFLTSNYDLYYFNQDGDSEGNEWINFEDTNDGGFNIVNGQGYLYASSTNTTLVFTGSAYSGNGQVNLTYSTDNADANMHGWNLVGNPFAQSAYINMPFYTLDGGSEYVEHAAGDEIQRMQGILVHTDAATTLTFSTTAPTKGSMVTLNVSQDRAIVDRAIVSFGEGRQLPKFQINPNHTKVYMPVDGKDYAVANAENEGEMPVNFKAESNGTYTLSFNTENVEFNYLHLIDNMTGNDIDLLSTPSYSFEAKTTDYASRFRLVFATGASEDNFAFMSNGNLIVSNEGEATLQVIDVNGRIVRSESISGSASVNMNTANGVYVIRLINGENVKTQKMVVR